MSRPLALALLLAAPFALSACHTAQPSPQRFAQVIQRVSGTPAQVLTRIKSDAAARGWNILDEGVDSVVVDFGTAVARIPVPTEYGLWGTRVSFRDTEVHGSALYMVNADSKGTTVTMWNNPIYWHPDYQNWLPGPYDLAPGKELLKAYADGEKPTSAAPAPQARPATVQPAATSTGSSQTNIYASSSPRRATGQPAYVEIPKRGTTPPANDNTVRR
jgi:hypothetical protein